jgi:hypothetical protein
VVFGAVLTWAIKEIHWLTGVAPPALATHGPLPGVVFWVEGSGQFVGPPLNGLLLRAWNEFPLQLTEHCQFESAAPLAKVVPELATKPVLKKTPPVVFMLRVAAESGKTVKKQSMHSKATGTRRVIVVFRNRLIVMELVKRIFSPPNRSTLR